MGNLTKQEIQALDIKYGTECSYINSNAQGLLQELLHIYTTCRVHGLNDLNCNNEAHEMLRAFGISPRSCRRLIGTAKSLVWPCRKIKGRKKTSLPSPTQFSINGNNVVMENQQISIPLGAIGTLSVQVSCQIVQEGGNYKVMY